MKHRIRINGEIKEIDCELGSGILDKHGREIPLYIFRDKLEIVND